VEGVDRCTYLEEGQKNRL